MANSYFQFKQFRVEQDRCAMKISTDAVLLGALALHNHPKRILDIGTGTGVIALMLAQRFQESIIDAVEIDESAASQALANIKASPWETRINLHPGAFQDYVQISPMYDLIVSNPPYYSAHLKAKDNKRNIALHTDELSFDELAQGVATLLADQGKFWLILPPRQFIEFEKIAGKFGLLPAEIFKLADRPGKDVIRIIGCFSRHVLDRSERKILLKDVNGEYSGQYSTLLNNFLIIF
jgi:tRNA1Val (adenine37-N6)-methyltransferase